MDLRQRGFNVTHYNLGIRRETSIELLQRWEAECDRRFASACDNRIVFSFGTNDTTLENGKTRVALSDSIANTREILSVASQKCPVLMISPGRSMMMNKTNVPKPFPTTLPICVQN